MSVYTNQFGGTTTYPAQVSFRAIALTANIELEWPLELATTTDIVPWIANVTATAGPWSITMPSADSVSPGNAVLISNIGANTFTVKDQGGNTILTLTAGTAWDLILTDNTTVNGTWYAIQRGAAASASNAAALAGFGLVAITTTLNQSMPVSVRTVNFAPGDTDRAKFFVWTGGAGTVTLPVPSTVGNNWFISIRNQGTGALALTPSSGLINGSASISLQPGDSCDISTDGTDYFTIGIGQAATFAFDYTSINIAGTGNYTLSGAELNRISYNFTGLLTGNRDIIVPATTQQYWITNATTGAFVLGIRTATQVSPGITVAAGASSILFCDGTNVRDADTQGLATPVSIVNGGTGANNAATARANLGSTAVGDALFIAASAAAARTTLGLGTMAVQNAAGVAITGGTLDSVAITNGSALNLTALSLLSTDAAAAAGPTEDIFRNSASPAAADAIGNITFTGKDSAANIQLYAEIAAIINDATSTSEDGQLNFNLFQAGSKVTAMKLALGLLLGTATGGDKGVGTVNAIEQYINGYAISDAMSGFLTGLGVSNNVADATNDIDFAVGAARDTTNVANIKLGSGITKRLDAAWAVGTNQGGLFSGAKANSTWYHLFVILRPDTGVVDAGFDTSITAANKPANYTYFRRVGSVLTDGAGAIRAFLQRGPALFPEFWWATPILDVDATNPPTTAVTRTLSTPLGVRVKALINLGGYTTAGTVPGNYVSDLAAVDLAVQVVGTAAASTPGANNVGGANASQWNWSEAYVWTDTSSQIRSRVSVTSATSHLGIVTLGWMDAL